MSGLSLLVTTESAVDYTDMDLMLKEGWRPDHPLDGVSRSFYYLMYDLVLDVVGADTNCRILKC